jgi:hypothetical protein
MGNQTSTVSGRGPSASTVMVVTPTSYGPSGTVRKSAGTGSALGGISVAETEDAADATVVAGTVVVTGTAAVTSVVAPPAPGDEVSPLAHAARAIAEVMARTADRERTPGR